MPSATLPARISDLIKYEEAESLYSRDDITLSSGNNLALGAVLGTIAATGEFGEFDPAAIDGRQTATAVLIVAADASLADVKTVALKRHAVVSKKAMVWKTGVTAGEILTALASLEARGIVAREAA
ncbi:MAG: head decoration protein [Sulfurimicrobium sp.]|nr:head decoration protein [Sulfurimicrobium sp.]